MQVQYVYHCCLCIILEKNASCDNKMTTKRADHESVRIISMVLDLHGVIVGSMDGCSL